MVAQLRRRRPRQDGMQRPARRAARQPVFPGYLGQDHRHAVVEPAQRGGRGAGQDGERRQARPPAPALSPGSRPIARPLPVPAARPAARPPLRPDPRHGEEPGTGTVDPVRLLARGARLPLVEAVRGNQAAPGQERFAVRRARRHRLGSRVDHARTHLRALGPVRHQPPPHRPGAPPLRRRDHDRRLVGRGHVVARETHVAKRLGRGPEGLADRAGLLPNGETAAHVAPSRRGYPGSRGPSTSRTTKNPSSPSFW